MACATLKRSLDWESLNQRPTKRRRCNPFASTSGTAQSSNAQVTGVKVTEPTQSAFADASHTKLTPGMHFFQIKSSKPNRVESNTFSIVSLSFVGLFPTSPCKSFCHLFRKNGAEHTRRNHTFASTKAVEFHVS